MDECYDGNVERIETALLAANEKLLKLEQSLAEKDRLIERLTQEAEAHAQEARTANNTIAEIYQVVSGKTGEPGNWHGAEPVKQRMAEKDREIQQIREHEFQRGYQERDQAYQQLMEKAVRFAKAYLNYLHQHHKTKRGLPIDCDARCLTELLQHVEREVLANVAQQAQRYQQFIFGQERSREFEAGFHAAARTLEGWLKAQQQELE